MEYRVKRSSTAGILICVGADTVTAVTPENERAYSVSLEESTAGRRAAFTQAFAALAGMIGSDRNASPRNQAVDIAIMPSLCEVRLVQLPPLKQAEVETIIRRDAGKHFTVSTEPRVIAVRLPPRSAANAPVMAASVSQVLLNDLTAAAASTEWTVRRFVPAYAAWLHASEASARPRAVIAVEGATAHVLRIDNNAVTEVRRMPASGAQSIADALGNTAGTATVFAESRERGDLTAGLSSAGWSVLPASTNAATTAARNAAAATPVFLTEMHHATRAVQQRTLANRLATAAVLLLLAAAAMAHWGASRELSALRERRASIRGRITPLLALRDSVDRLESRTRETDALFASLPRWSRTLYEMTILLPTDAHLTRLNATGDTVVIEGEAARAGDVLEAIARAPSLRNVQLTGPVQRDLADGTTTAERFVIQATLASAAKAPAKPKRHVTAPARSNSDSAVLNGRLP
jgi:Tfp pilus assembly protein PilN